jgi:hypothetical protein
MAGALAGGISLVGFGIDSFIEVASAATLLCRMSVDADENLDRKRRLPCAAPNPRRARYSLTHTKNLGGSTSSASSSGSFLTGNCCTLAARYAANGALRHN